MSDFAFRGRGPTPLLPPELRAEAQNSVRRMVIDRSSNNQLFATVAWSWFGTISEDLLRKHGLATYFNVSLEAMYFGVDGLTSLVLLSADGFHRPPGFGEEHALSALAAVGRFGFGGGPLVREDFDQVFSPETAPLVVWKRALSQLRKVPEACAGAFLVFLIVQALSETKTEALSETITSDELDKGGDESVESFRNSIKHLVLSARTIKKLELYPRMVEMAAGSVFGESSSSEISQGKS